MIARLNSQFVCTWVLIQEASELASRGASPELRELGATLAANWRFPMDLMFLRADGSFDSKLNSLDDFNPSPRSNERLLFAHIDRNFGPPPSAAAEQ